MTNYRVYICAGRNCTPKGSLQLQRSLEEEIVRLALEEQVSVFAGGCQSHCETGPSVVIYPGPVFYQHIDKHKLARIAREHLANDRPVDDYLHADTRRFRQAKTGKTERAFTPAPAFPVATQHEKRSQESARKPKPKKTYDVDEFKW